MPILLWWGTGSHCIGQAIVSDNLKAAVSKSCKYQPGINKTLKSFALHYGCVIDPARPYHPQDKALVENAVRLVYQRIFYPLGDQPFFSLNALNQQIALLLNKYNEYRFQHLPYSRKELFLEVEKPLLSVLPTHAYCIRHYLRGKVQKMGHVFMSAGKHYYSVPHRFIGQEVKLEYTEEVVEVFTISSVLLPISATVGQVSTLLSKSIWPVHTATTHPGARSSSLNAPPLSVAR